MKNLIIQVEMKKINILILGFLLMVGFTACQEDPIVTINPLAEAGDISFQLNNAQYSNFTYVLEEANNGLDMGALTTQQPDYGFTAAVTYYIQASFSQDMKDSVELASSVQGENVAINVKDMDKALFELYKGKMPRPSVAKDVYVRLRAVVSTSTPSPLDNEPIVKSLFSNVVKLNILPYYIPPIVYYYEAEVLRPYYIIGYNGWNNDKDHLGSELMPLGVVEEKVYNDEGDGVWRYTGYFESAKEFKLIRDIGSWNEQWGNKGGAGINQPISKAIAGEEPSNLKVPKDGYYTITLNSIKHELKVEEITITPTAYLSIGLVGQMTGWADNADILLSQYQSTNNHDWYTTYTFTADSPCKFRANGTWDVNWGTPSSIEPDPAYSYAGIGKLGGKNMIQTVGTYVVIFNDITGNYYFIKK